MASGKSANLQDFGLEDQSLRFNRRPSRTRPSAFGLVCVGILAIVTLQASW